MSHNHPALEQAFESHTVRRRAHGGSTWAIYTGLQGVGARFGGEPLRRFTTDQGAFSAVGPAAEAYNDSLIGRFIRIDWIQEGGDKVTREQPLILTPPPETEKPPGISWHDHLDAERKGRQAAEAALPDNRNAITARRISICPKCSRAVYVGDPLLRCFEGWAHARCVSKQRRDPPICRLCSCPVSPQQEAHHQTSGLVHMDCVTRPR